jgi:uncharacterized protein (DUF433 family)
MTTRAETEAEKMQQVPGIEFVDTPTGRMARVAGTGVRVWLIARDYRDIVGRNGSVGGSVTTLTEEQRAAQSAYAQAFPKRRVGPALAALWHWLTPEQIEVALTYYSQFPDEINRRIAQDDAAATSIA